MNKVLVGIAFVTMAAIGVAVGHYTADPQAAPLPENMILVKRSAYSELQAQKLELAAELDTVRSERDGERTKAAQLTAELASLQQRVADDEAVRTAAAEIEAAGTIPVAFGKYAELDGVKNANWNEMAEAVEIMTDMFLEAIALENEGKQPPPGFTQTLRSENNKLVKYLGGVATHIDSQASINGEFTHPVTLTNILAAMLEREDLTLDDQQRRHIIAHGEAYDVDYDRLQGSYDEQTPQQRKLLDELALKRTTMRQIEDELTSDQRDVVIEPSLHDRLQVDPGSPVQMLALTVNAFKHDSPEQLRAALPTLITRLYQIPPEDLAGLDPAFDRYMEAVESLLTPIPEEELITFFHIDDAIVAGEAYAELIRAVLAHPAIDDSARQRIRENPRWPVPRIREQTQEQ